ncbi:MAG: molybdopterin cofactor-binding domain-containing protein [Sporichthyaceae bacterium]
MSPTPITSAEASAETTETPTGTSRRQFVGYVLAGTTFAVTADLAFDSASTSAAAESATPILSNALVADAYDFMDSIRDASIPTNYLLSIEMRSNGTAFFSLPRSENGQAITTSFAQVIADEADMDLKDVLVEISDARPELMFNQLTGGSCSLYSLYEPVRVMAATLRAKMLEAAAQKLGTDVSRLRTKNGMVISDGGEAVTYADLLEIANEMRSPYKAQLGPVRGTWIGKSVKRVDARNIVTGGKKFTNDLNIPNALPTMICRPPTFKGQVGSVLNMAAIKKMPGVTDVAVIPIHAGSARVVNPSSGVAVRARTFGQCIDAVRALKVEWAGGTKDSSTSDSLIEEIDAVLLPIAPAATLGSEVFEQTYVNQFRSGSPMETNNAIADVRADSVEVWAPSKMPIIALQTIAERLNLSEDKVTFHVMQGGGSFGRKLFADAAIEAVEASRAFGKPVKLLWHRADDNRHGRMYPGSVTKIQATKVGNSVTSFSLRHASASTDLTHGFGEIISGSSTASPDGELGNLSIAAGFFQLVTSVPYNFGPTDLALNEVFDFDTLPSSAVRNVYSPNVTIARELMVEKLAKAFNMDGYEFRRAFAKTDNDRAVLDKVAKAGNWGRKMPKGFSQAIALHTEYKATVACLMELDNRPQTVNRKIRDAFTGPRITKAVMAIDIGLPINPNGVKQMLLGGLSDGIAYAMSAAVHIEDGLPAEASWDNYRYTRQWNTPTDTQFFVMPANRDLGGGAGEVGIAVAAAAAAIAFQNATGKEVTEFPVNFREPLGFAVKSKIPPIPQSPINGRRFAR